MKKAERVELDCPGCKTRIEGLLCKQLGLIKPLVFKQCCDYIQHIWTIDQMTATKHLALLAQGSTVEVSDDFPAATPTHIMIDTMLGKGVFDVLTNDILIMKTIRMIADHTIPLPSAHMLIQHEAEKWAKPDQLAFLQSLPWWTH